MHLHYLNKSKTCKKQIYIPFVLSELEKFMASRDASPKGCFNFACLFQSFPSGIYIPINRQQVYLIPFLSNQKKIY